MKDNGNIYDLSLLCCAAKCHVSKVRQVSARGRKKALEDLARRESVQTLIKEIFFRYRNQNSSLDTLSSIQDLNEIIDNVNEG